MRRFSALLGGVGVLAVTAACGQKGALYLPPKSGTVVTRPAPSTTQSPQTSDQGQASQPSPGQTVAPNTTPPQPKDKNKQDDSQPPQ
jgi:predicted small lipoprotein YifL